MLLFLFYVSYVLDSNFTVYKPNCDGEEGEKKREEEREEEKEEKTAAEGDADHLRQAELFAAVDGGAVRSRLVPPGPDALLTGAQLSEI
jgi:hypothetical protein